LSEKVDILEFDFSSAINGEKFKEFFGLTENYFGAWFSFLGKRMAR